MIYFDYLRLQVKATVQYRASTLMVFGVKFVQAFGFFFIILFLFERFGSLIGWRFEEVLLCYGVSSAAFNLHHCFAQGFYVFQRYVRSGDFDRMLTRPRGTILQVFGCEFGIAEVAKALQGVIVLLYACSLFNGWTALKILCAALMVLCGMAVFTGVSILGASVCFLTVKGLEFVNIFTYGGQEIASYPIPIYAKSIVRFFTFVLPYACFNYLPLQYITGRVEQPWPLLYPIAGMLFIVPCLAVWRIGLRQYVSTGS